jgi:hypothetical protein
MTKLEIVKEVVTIAVTVGVGIVVNTAVKNNTPETMGLLKKSCVALGGFMLAGAISEKVSDYTERLIDETVEKKLCHIRRIYAYWSY